MAYPMQFEKTRDSLIAHFGAKQGTNWRTIGYAEKDQSAKENNILKTLQIYYNSGDFPKAGSSLNGPVRHNMSFSLMLTVAVGSVGDKEALENATTAEEYAAASATFTRSEEECDRALDEFMRIIYQTAMSADFQNLGLASTEDKISNRWIGSFRKDKPNQTGNFTINRALLTLEAQTPEYLSGVVPGIEYEKSPFDGTNIVKNNTPMSGILDPGVPVSTEI